MNIDDSFATPGIGAAISRRRLLGVGAAALWLAATKSADADTINRTFYVAKTGNDNNPGTLTKPFATINAVFRRITDLGAGDRILVSPGTYNEAVNVKAGGSAAGNLMLVSKVRGGAKIRSPASSYSAIAIEKNYVTIDGFDVQSGGTGHGIEASWLNGGSNGSGPHHITVINNTSHNNAGSGISLAYGDYYLVENNTCYRNCATNSFQGSGISIYEPRAVSGSDTWRIFVLRNTSYSNTALNLPNNVPHSDGNGIIMDDFRNTQQPNGAGVYGFRSLVENNVCYLNGGKGVHIFISDNVTVRNNTCYFNNRDLKNPATWRGELSNVSSNNTIFVNNVGYADVKVNAYNCGLLHASASGQTSNNVLWMRNVSFNGTVGSAALTQSPYNSTLTAAAPYNNLLGVNPRFVKAGRGVVSPNLRLQRASSLRNAAITDYGIGTIDRDGKRRVFGAAPDIGAYELQS
jgi:parallel beta-helix repeat protein